MSNLFFFYPQKQPSMKTIDLHHILKRQESYKISPYSIVEPTNTVSIPCFLCSTVHLNLHHILPHMAEMLNDSPYKHCQWKM